MRKEHAEWDGRAIRGEARRRFKRMLRETPSIGSYRSNCWKMNLVGGAVWFSLYEAVEELYGRMSGELYGKMCNATYAIPFMARKYASTLATGDLCCDYLYTRPGSDAEKKWQEDHPKGTFISK